MRERSFATIDGSEAVVEVAYRVNEVIAIYPITPSSPIGEWAIDSHGLSRRSTLACDTSALYFWRSQRCDGDASDRLCFIQPLYKRRWISR